MHTSIRGLLAASLFIAGGLAATPAWADEETAPPSEFTITGNVALVTDYRFRGLSLSGGDPAVQGSINVNHASGLYIGTWASSLEEDLGYGSIETDIYAGWTGSLASGITADVGLLYYAYFNSGVGDNLNYFEPYVSLSTTLGPVIGKVGVTYAWTQDAIGGDDSLYLYTDIGTGIPNSPVSLLAHLGYTSGALSPNRLTFKSLDGGFDYSVGATFAVSKNLSLGASYVGMDGNSFDGFSNDTVVGTLKLSF